MDEAKVIAKLGAIVIALLYFTGATFGAEDKRAMRYSAAAVFLLVAHG